MAQATTKELIEEFMTGEGINGVINYVIPEKTDRRRGRNYTVVFKDGTRSTHRFYFNTYADGTHYVEDME